MAKTMCRNCHERTYRKMGQTSTGRAVPLCRVCSACKCSDCVAIAEKEQAERMRLQPDPMRPVTLNPDTVWGP
jgi:NAD-dependent SIR2 family protein deacetylase